MTTHQIQPEWHVKIKLRGRNISITRLVKQSTLDTRRDVDDVKSVYMQAWKLGCKGVTIYRMGVRGSSFISKSENQ